MSTATPILTAEDLFAFPDNGRQRELIQGELREREMTKRNRLHAATEARIVYVFLAWIASHPECAVDVLSGEAGSILARDPDTSVGIDVAIFALELLRNQSRESAWVVGVPLLAVEILSPSDRHEEIHEKIEEYLRVGVKIVWEVDPDFQTVRVHRPGTDPFMVNRSQTLAAEEVLPGFSVSVRDLFPTWATKK